MHVRRAAPGEHLDAAAAVWAAAVSARDGYAQVPPLEVSRPILSAVLESSARAFLLLALDGDTAAPERVIGVVAGCPLAEAPSTADVRYVGVLPEAWGRGVARALLGALPSYLTEAGFTAARLDVYVDNVRAVRLYVELGWCAHGEPVAHPASGRLEQEYRLSSLE